MIAEGTKKQRKQWYHNSFASLPFSKHVSNISQVHKKETQILIVSFRANLDGMIFPYDCSMRLAHIMSTTWIVSSKSDLLHLHDSRTQHEKCRRILKHVLKPYDSRSHNQLEWRVVYDLCLTQAACATKVAYDSRKQKSYSVNWPLGGVNYRLWYHFSYLFQPKHQYS